MFSNTIIVNNKLQKQQLTNIFSKCFTLDQIYDYYKVTIYHIYLLKYNKSYT